MSWPGGTGACTIVTGSRALQSRLDCLQEGQLRERSTVVVARGWQPDRHGLTNKWTQPDLPRRGSSAAELRDAGPHNNRQAQNMRHAVYPCLLAMVLLLGFAPNLRAQAAVPVHREVRHQLVLDSTRFRVLDVQIPPGDTTGFHIHDATILYVSLALSPTSAQIAGGEWPASPARPPRSAIGNVRIDSSYVLQPITHRVTNMGDSLFRLLAITSSGPAPGSVTDGRGALPGIVELRSTWFQQSGVELAAQAVTEWFVSERPVLVVQPLAMRLAVECDGRPLHTLAHAGSWLLVPTRVRCRIVNVGLESATAVAIQIR